MSLYKLVVTVPVMNNNTVTRHLYQTKMSVKLTPIIRIDNFYHMFYNINFLSALY